MRCTCQACGVEAPTRKVMFVQHIGAVVMFFHKRIGGHFCRNCVRQYFSEYTLKTLFFGWWGMVSVVATPIVLLINLANWLRVWSLEPVPAGATAPQLTNVAIASLHPHTGDLIDQINAKTPLETVARDIAAKAKVTPGQVVRYLQALVDAQNAKA